MSRPLISTEQRRRRLARRHLLASGTGTDDVAQITDALLALHASDPATVFLTALARMNNPSVERIEDTIYEDRSVVRHHAMRRTIWVMGRETVRLAHATTTAKIAAGEQKKNVKAVAASGIADPENWFAEARAEVLAYLAEVGIRSTRQIGEELPHLAVPLEYGSAKHSATLNAHSKLLQGAAFDGDLVRVRPNGTWISSEYPWTITEKWLGGPIAGLETRPAAAELVERWLRQFGPGTETDLVWWFGETKTLIRNALADCGAVEVDLDDGSTGWVAADDAMANEDDVDPWVRLLPGLDPTAMGWKERDWYLDPTWVEPMFDRFGNIGPSIWVDGRIVGGWMQREDASINVELFTEIDAPHRRLLDDAVGQLEAAVGGVVVKPRFPARMTKALAAS